MTSKNLEKIASARQGVRRTQAEQIYNNILTHKIIPLVGHGKTTDNFELRKVGKQLFHDKFVGVFSSDSIPKLKKNTYCIANLDPKDKPGSHWVSMVKLNNGRIGIYDSFGRKSKTILPNFKRLLKDTDLDAEQRIEETNCGQRCCAWLYVYDKYGWGMAKHI